MRQLRWHGPVPPWQADGVRESVLRKLVPEDGFASAKPNWKWCFFCNLLRLRLAMTVAPIGDLGLAVASIGDLGLAGACDWGFGVGGCSDRGFGVAVVAFEGDSWYELPGEHRHCEAGSETGEMVRAGSAVAS